LRTLFDIGSETGAGSEHTLLLEVGKGHCYTALFNKKANTIDRMKLTSFDEWEAEQHLTSLLGDFQPASIDAVTVCSAYPQALLVPHKFFTDDYTMLDLVYDQPAQLYLNDRIQEWQMVTVYSVPETVSQVLRQHFSSVQYIHAYTPTIKVYNGYVADNQLLVHFTDQHFRVILKVNMAICLAQTYLYKSPLDVVYYLLKICYEFNLSQEQVFLVLSGLVEKDSQLFTELQQYFTHVNFAQQPEIGLPQSNHPHHFFTSIYNLAACVS
jgi:hypothetical protein